MRSFGLWFPYAQITDCVQHHLVAAGYDMGDERMDQEQLDLFGFWFVTIGDGKKIKCAGRCVYKDGKGTLDLILDDDFDRHFLHDNLQDFHYIYGITNKGDCTLPFCRISKFTSTMYGAHSLTFRADYVFVGHVFSIEDKIFNKCSFRIDGLYAWLGCPHLKGTIAAQGFNITYNQESECVAMFSIDENATISMHICADISHGVTSGSFNTCAHIEIDTQQVSSYTYYHKLILGIRDFLCVLFGFSPRIYSVNLAHIGEDNKYKIHTSINTPKTKHSPVENRSLHDFLIRDISENDIAIAANNFFKNRDKYKGIMHNLIEIYSDVTMPIQHAMYRHIQNIEVLSREFHNVEYCNKDEFDSFIKEYKGTIKKICPDKLKDKLLSATRSLNEYTLADKISHAINMIESNTSWRAGEKCDALISKAVKTRNELTHHIVQGKSRLEGGQWEALDLVKRVSLSLICSNIGIPWDSIEAGILSDSPFFR